MWGDTLVGERHIERRYSEWDEEYKVVVEFEALHSVCLGNQPAAKTERLISDVDAAIAPIEPQLEELLAS